MSISKLEMNEEGVSISFHDGFSYQDKLINWIGENTKSASIRGNNLLFIRNIDNVENSALSAMNQLKVIDESIYN